MTQRDVLRIGNDTLGVFVFVVAVPFVLTLVLTRWAYCARVSSVFLIRFGPVVDLGLVAVVLRHGPYLVVFGPHTHPLFHG